MDISNIDIGFIIDVIVRYVKYRPFLLFLVLAISPRGLEQRGSLPLEQQHKTIAAIDFTRYFDCVRQVYT